MSRAVLILRPEPGANATAARARARGLEPILAPLFAIAPRLWALPDKRFDAVLMTSANAARHGGDRLATLHELPLYAVGTATADAARAAGFGQRIEAGPDVLASYARLRADGRQSVLHLAGEHRTSAEPDGLRVEIATVYAAEAIEPPPRLADALVLRPVALLHSPRAARRFADCVDAEAIPRSGVRAAAISVAAAEALGAGWGRVEGSAIPTDDALLELAARMCD